MWEFVLELGLVLLWVIAVVFSLIGLSVKLIVKLVKVCKKKKSVPMSRWSTLAAAAQVVNVLLLVVTFVMVSSYAVANSYMWVFYGFALLLVLMLGLAVYGVVKMHRVQLSRFCMFYNWVTVVMLLTTVANVIYWNLFMWWIV